MLTRKKCSPTSLFDSSSFLYSYVQPFFCTLLLLLLRNISINATSIYAQGNLAIVFEAQYGKTSDSSPLHYNLTELWCQATANGEDKLPIKLAKFVQVQPPPTKVHKGEVEGNRAHLRFGRVTPSAAGKYKCEITTATFPADYVTGNLFVYMRPVVYTNGSLRLDQAEEGNSFHLVSTPNKVVRGETARLSCPVIGYPIPSIRWFRDGEPISSQSDKFVLLDKQLHIREADDPDEGIYRCVASNRFPMEVDGPEQDFQVVLDQHLRVSSSLSWMIPLIVIMVILILLFLTIYLCAAYKRYKHAQYNVAQKEKCLRKAEEQQLQEDEDE